MKGRKPKLTPEQVVEVKALRANGATIVALAAQYHVSVPTIYKALKAQVLVSPITDAHGNQVA